jgi:tripartite ATP-independent transporter DctM subunit
MAIMGAPIFAVFSMLALCSFYFADIQVSAVTVEMLRLSSHPTLLAIPLFTFAGYLMAESKTPSRLLNLAQAALGWMPGGVAIVSLLVCAVFTAFTGGSGVTIIALGGLLFPILTQKGYSETFTLGLVSASGSLGLLFPPSLPIILYGLVAKVDIDQLFLAGIVPGFVLIIVLSLYSIYRGRELKKDTAAQEPFSWSQLRRALWEARYELPIPFFVLIGIYGGFTTASEASAVVAAYVLLMTCVLYRDLHWRRDLPRITQESMTLVGAILLILACALGFVNYIVDEEVPMQILAFMKQHIDSQLTFLLCLNIFLLIVGMMLDIFSAIIVVVPIIVPIALEFGVHPVHLAVIFLTNLEIGYLTPPVGLNLFIASFRFNKPVTQIYRASIPFLILLLIGLILVTYIPYISLFWFE